MDTCLMCCCVAAGKDALVVSQTGSGKTLSFLVPLLVSCASQHALAMDLHRAAGAMALLAVAGREGVRGALMVVGALACMRTAAVDQGYLAEANF